DRVPVVAPGGMMMAKRSRLFPRVIGNDAQVATTDTIYRGRLLANTTATPAEFTAAFHNSLTLLTAEIEGRSFGGGVLELVPSEVGRLLIPMPDGFGVHLDRLDAILRSTIQLEAPSDALIEETDRLLIKADTGFSPPLMDL